MSSFHAYPNVDAAMYTSRVAVTSYLLTSAPFARSSCSPTLASILWVYTPVSAFYAYLMLTPRFIVLTSLSHTETYKTLCLEIIGIAIIGTTVNSRHNQVQSSNQTTTNLGFDVCCVFRNKMRVELLVQCQGTDCISNCSKAALYLSEANQSFFWRTVV